MTTTLEQFIVEQEYHTEDATGSFSKLLRDLMLAAKIIHREVNLAGLANILGSTGQTNIQGEQVTKLDVFANHQLIRMLSMGGQVCALASEENDEVILLPDSQGKYVVLFDPLDGSSNIDVSAPIGTIFAIYRRLNQDAPPSIADCLQPGNKQIAAGYVLYGSSTILVYATKRSVNGFTLDPSLGEFLLSHPNIKFPQNGNTYSVNEGNFERFEPGLKSFLQYLKQEDKATNRPYTGRYIGTLVADFHRNLIKGGIYIYAGLTKNPKGKLRLLYECNPLSFIAEQAGGKASNGNDRIMDTIPVELHQRTPIFIGNAHDVELVEQMMASEKIVF
ncbi:MAG: class 1 fructose-bisphosphatase [Bacteroidia bacterium]|nr:class 1 fructose-bisphosphatase [Bacteroidia bacterium]